MQSPHGPRAGAAAASTYGGSPARRTKRDATREVMQSPYGPPDPGAGGASSPYRPGATTTSPYAAGGTGGPLPPWPRSRRRRPAKGKNLELQWLPPLSPSWAAASIQGEDGRTEFQMIADEVEARPPRIFLGELAMAATKVQRVERGIQCRSRLWCVDLPGGATYTRLALVAASSNPPSIHMSTLAHHWARKGQKRWRGVLGRRKAVRRAEAYVYRAATLMAAVCRGGAARRLARAMRAAVFETAAWRVQRAFRDKMVRKMLAEARRLRRARMRGRMQRCWRMALAKRRAARFAVASAVAAARLDALSAAARLARAQKERNKLELPPDDAPSGPWEDVVDPVGKVVAFKACSLVPFEWEVASLIGGDEYEKPEEKKKEEPVDEALDPLAAYKARKAAAELEKETREKIPPGVLARAAASDPLLHVAHALALGDGNCDSALSVLEAASPSPMTMATKAACRQLGWACATKYKLVLPDWLDEALDLIKKARIMDESRHAGVYFERAFLRNAVVMWYEGYRAPNARAFCGAALASSRGDPHLEPMCSDGAARVKRTRDTARATYHLDLTQKLAESEGGGDLSAFAGPVACADAHDALFTRTRDPVIERMRDLRCVRDINAACEIADFEDAEAAKPPSSRPQTRTQRPDTASGSWHVRVFACGDAFVCTAERSAATKRGSPVTARDHVLLLHDLEELAKLHFPKSEQAAALRDGRLAEVVWDKLVLVGGDGKGGPSQGVPPSLQVPEVARARAAAVRLAMETFCAILVQRAYRGFDAASMFKRNIFRLREKDRQRASVAIRRAQRLLAQLKRDLGISKFQACVRGRQFRALRKREMKAAALLQAYARGVRKRMQDKEEAERKLLGAPVETVFVGGKQVGGVDLVLTVTRCGMNYKFSGQDFAAQTTYIGVCPSSTVEAAINAANSERQRGEKIRRLNNREDVLFVLLDRLALVDAIYAPTKELRGGGRVLVVDASKRASGGGPSVTKLWGLGRRLDDGALMLRDYENNQRRHNEARAARGLGPKQPSVIELQKAKAAFKARLGSNPVSAKVLRERKKAARKRLEAQEAEVL